MSEADARSPTPKGFWVIWSTVALDQIVFSMVLPVLPFVARRYGASPIEVTALVAVFALSQFLISPLVGALSDRFGRKPVLVISLFGSAIGSLILGVAGTLPLLFLGRAVDGLSGTALVSAQTAITDMVGPAKRARYLGLMGTAFAVGFIVGPMLSAFASQVDARLPFFIAAGLGVLNALVAIVRLPETRPPEVRDALVSSRAAGSEDRSPFGFLRDTKALNGATLFYIGVLATGLLAFSSVEGGAFTLLADDRFGFDQTSIAWVFVWIGVVLAVVQVTLVAPFNENLGIRRTLMAALAVNVVGFTLLAGADLTLLMIIGITANSVGQGLLRPTCTTAVSNSVAPQYRGRAIGTQTSAQGLVRIVGPLMAGLLYGGIGPGAPFAVAALITVATAIAVASFGPRWDTALATGT